MYGERERDYFVYVFQGYFDFKIYVCVYSILYFNFLIENVFVIFKYFFRYKVRGVVVINNKK